MPKEHKKEHKAQTHTEQEHHLEHKHRQDFWKYSTAALVVVVLLLAVLALGGTANQAKTVLSPQDASDKAIAWINDYFSSMGNGMIVNLVNSSRTDNGVYTFTVNMTSTDGSYMQTYYVSQDGLLFFPQYFETNKTSESTSQTGQQPQQTSIPKSDKPVVELFVMSYCPYGTQAEKGIIPAVEALGDKIDFKIRFVSYAMHGQQEIDENTAQYCIQKEQTSKLLDYMSCFLVAGNQSSCLASTGINQAQLDACIAAADTEFSISANVANQGSSAYPAYDVDKALNEQYGVSGSPTLVINGVNANSARSPAAYLSTICSAFNTAPSECSQTLSSATPSAGFGEGSSTGSSASCS